MTGVHAATKSFKFKVSSFKLKNQSFAGLFIGSGDPGGMFRIP